MKICYYFTSYLPYFGTFCWKLKQNSVTWIVNNLETFPQVVQIICVQQKSKVLLCEEPLIRSIQTSLPVSHSFNFFQFSALSATPGRASLLCVVQSGLTSILREIETFFNIHYWTIISHSMCSFEQIHLYNIYWHKGNSESNCSTLPFHPSSWVPAGESCKCCSYSITFSCSSVRL